MKYFFRLFCFSTFFLFLLASTSGAMGVGFYGSLGSGSEDWDIKNGSLSDDKDMDSDYSSYGIVWDTDLSGKSLFSYRISIGKEYVRSDVKDSDTKVKLDGLVIDQDFRFTLARKPKINFWIGPQLRLSRLEGSPDTAPGLDMEIFGIGFGPAGGFNLELGPSLLFALKGGFLFTHYEGEGKYSTGGNKDEYDINRGQGLISCALLFRFDEE